MPALTDEPKFKIGDIVYLNSGSPKLTVSNMWKTGILSCITVSWVDDENHRQEWSLPEACFTALSARQESGATVDQMVENAINTIRDVSPEQRTRTLENLDRKLNIKRAQAKDLSKQLADFVEEDEVISEEEIGQLIDEVLDATLGEIGVPRPAPEGWTNYRRHVRPNQQPQPGNDVTTTAPDWQFACLKPPYGWRCTREHNHKGPCATVFTV